MTVPAAVPPAVPPTPPAAVVVPTQVQFPGRAVIRTVVATALTAFAVLNILTPTLADVVHKTLPSSAYVWVNSVAAGITVVSGAITRIMAIPQVDQWLKSLGLSAIK